MKQKDKIALLEFDALIKEIRQATPILNLNETEQQKQARIKKLLSSYPEFIAYYFPNYSTSKLAKFHVEVVNYTANNKRFFAAIEWARDHAKSSTLWMLQIWLMLKKEINTAITVSKSKDNATKLIEPIRANLEANNRLIQDFGEFKSINNWNSEDFKTSGGTNFVALGRGQSPRGIRNEAIRPDFICVDDIDDDELVENPERVEKLWKWVMTALFPSMSIVGKGRFIIAENRYADDSIIARAVEKAKILKKQGYPAYHKRINLLDTNGQPSWKERFTLKDCQYMIEALGYIFSQREYFNNPIREGRHFKPEFLQYCTMGNLKTYPVLIAYCDPSFSDKGDTKALVLLGRKDGQYHILKTYCAKASVDQMVAWHYELQTWLAGKNAAATFYMEEVFYQSLLYSNFAEYAKKHNLPPFPINGDKRAKPAKIQRLLAITGHYERGNVYFNTAEQENRHMQNLLEQHLSFNPPHKTPLDGIDAIEGAMYLIDRHIEDFAGALRLAKRTRNPANSY
ncbi:MAG: hypothetical protein IPI59_15600 [Sphingobacteriales bacterium]|jgi:phage terminase large subunit-like protein|nr:hypothetical protein [Sphingobacteriales bacterium]MBP6663907.1 hypothetical protein [Chitinophagales bacterium]MDA0199689.1 hypothetical protein [Bacteroidota bacterium]MBK7528921.1 hypothetical protein [Sphingobacteriales bacterium]MBK8679088.1 hypothetical protein [Sphingobacteriales bacterium]